MLIITHKYTIIHGCVGKKTAQFDKLIAMLLQTLVSRRLVWFVPIKIGMLFCALAVHYITFSFCLYVANCLLCRSPIHLALTNIYTKYILLFLAFICIEQIYF